MQGYISGFKKKPEGEIKPKGHRAERRQDPSGWQHMHADRERDRERAHTSSAFDERRKVTVQRKDTGCELLNNVQQH